MKLLIAEDDFVARGLLEKLLDTFGFETVTAEDGLAAWNAYRETDLRMVITDWDMPEMNGLDLCKKIRADKSKAYTYVIIVTAKGNNTDAIEGLQAGADDYIVKPIDPAELKARIRTGQRILQLEDRYKKAGAQLMQSEKMASIGQLAAGVAHEINNPTGFVSSNLKSMLDYQKDLMPLIAEYRSLVAAVRHCLPDQPLPREILDRTERIAAMEAEADIDFIMDDAIELIEDCREGAERIKKIVQDLKDFAHPGESKAKFADLNRSIDSTLNVVWNELKYKANVVKDYGDLPEVRCYPQQLNQVFMNLLVNAAQAIEKDGEIRITTRADNGHVEIQIADTGVGIPGEHLSRVFDPFFTTKEVGKGTGLGLNVAYHIIEKHQGAISVDSRVGEGTTFTIRLKAEQAPSEAP